jgi:hypothetical protein
METQANTQQDEQSHEGKRAGRQFNWRAFISVTTALSFLAMSVTGVVLFVTPPGRIAHWTGWRMLALTKDQWGGLHIWFSLVFMVVAALHIYLNWGCLLGYFRDKVRKAFTLRKEWVLALLICVIVGWGTLAEVAPFSSVLTWNEAIKRSWETPVGQAPIPHAELMTLREIAEKTDGVEAESMAKNLRASGIHVESPDAILGELAKKAGMTPRQLYAVATGGDGSRHVAPGRNGSGRQNQRGVYGMGRLTLREYCAQEGLDVNRAAQKLRKSGLKAEPDMSLREIADTGGIHLSVIRDMLKQE